MLWAIACCWLAVGGNYLLIAAGLKAAWIVPFDLFAVPLLVTVAFRLLLAPIRGALLLVVILTATVFAMATGIVSPDQARVAHIFPLARGIVERGQDAGDGRHVGRRRQVRDDRVEERLQDVPIAVTAYSGEALERQGALDITDISDTTPNVTLARPTSVASTNATTAPGATSAPSTTSNESESA